RARDLEAARPDPEHAAGTCMRRVRVAAEPRISGHVEVLHVSPMTDPVSGSREQRPVSLADAPKEPVIARVLVAGLEDVVVHILGGLPDRDAILPHLFELKPGERARRVLEERLIHPDRDLFARMHRAFGEMGTDPFVGEGFPHETSRRVVRPSYPMNVHAFRM